MKPADIDQLQQRFSDLEDRHRSQSTFVQFLEGVRQIFSFDPEGSVGLSDPAPLRQQLETISERLKSPAAPRLRSRLDEIRELLDESGAALLQEDSKVPPAIQRQFFVHVTSYEEGTIERLLFFYLRERDPVQWGPDELDRVDFLGTRLVEDSAGHDGVPDWKGIQAVCRSLNQVRARRWGPSERVSEQDRNLLPAIQKSPIAVRESDEMTEVIDRFRGFKHRLGLRLLQPETWPEILRANWQIKRAVKQVLQREERLVLADVERVFEIESRIVPPPPLVTELAGLRQQIETFEEAVQTESIRLEEFGGLRRSLATTLRHLEAADVANQAGVLGGEERAKPTVWREEEEESRQAPPGLLEGTIFADGFRRLLTALAEADSGGNPEMVIQHPALTSLEMAAGEVEAYRHLRQHGPVKGQPHRMLLEAAVVRQQLHSRGRDLRLMGREDPNRPKAVLAARGMLAAAGRFMSALESSVAKLRRDGDLQAAEEVEKMRAAIEKQRSEVWLLVQVGV